MSALVPDTRVGAREFVENFVHQLEIWSHAIVVQSKCISSVGVVSWSVGPSRWTVAIKIKTK